MNYINFYANFLKRSIQIERSLKFVFDCSNGTTGLVLKKLLKTNSLINHKLINQIPDGDFPAHGPDPLKKFAISNLQSAIRKNKADLGAIFDADGDRVFFADNRGRFIDPDIIARLLIWRLKPKKIIIDVRAGWLVKKCQMSNVKCKMFISKVGHYFIKKMMRETKSDFGAESSGHYYFPLKTGRDICYADFGILAAIHVINAVSGLPYTLADFVDLSPQYYRSGEISIKIQNSKFSPYGRSPVGRKNQNDPEQIPSKLYGAGNFKFKILLNKIERKYKSRAAKMFHLDGLTVKTDHFWFNIRFSNTEPLLRLNIEAVSPEILKKEKNKLTKIIGSAIN